MNAEQWKLLEELKEENAKLRAEVRALEHRISSWMEENRKQQNEIANLKAELEQRIPAYA